MEGERGCGFGLTLGRLYRLVLIVPDLYGLVLARSCDQRLTDADVHGDNGGGVEMEAYLLKMSTDRVLGALEPHLALDHHSTRQQSQDLIVIRTDAPDLYFLLRQLEGPLGFIAALLKPEKPDILTANQEPLRPVTDRPSSLLNPLDNAALVVDDEGCLVGENCDVGGRAEVVMGAEGVLLSELVCALFLVLFNSE